MVFLLLAAAAASSLAPAADSHSLSESESMLSLETAVQEEPEIEGPEMERGAALFVRDCVAHVPHAVGVARGSVEGGCLHGCGDLHVSGGGCGA
jgi:hypothetical protein